MQALTLQGFLLRLLFAMLLVMLSYNPGGYSYVHWIKNINGVEPLTILAGISLVIGWVIYIRATLRSLGAIGLSLALLFFGSLIWLLVDWGWLGMDNLTSVSWVILVLLSFILAIGMSWSHIRRRLSGQLDANDADDA